MFAQNSIDALVNVLTCFRELRKATNGGDAEEIGKKFDQLEEKANAYETQLECELLRHSRVYEIVLQSNFHLFQCGVSPKAKQEQEVEMTQSLLLRLRKS